MARMDTPKVISDDSRTASEAPADVTAGGRVPDAFGLDTSFTQSFDALEWAKAFVAYVEANPSIATDVATMHGWFANAIMRGYDEHARRREDAHHAIVSALQAAQQALEDTAAQASLCANQTALTSWPKQRDWLVSEVRAVARGGISRIKEALASLSSEEQRQKKDT